MPLSAASPGAPAHRPSSCEPRVLLLSILSARGRDVHGCQPSKAGQPQRSRLLPSSRVTPRSRGAGMEVCAPSSDGEKEARALWSPGQVEGGKESTDVRRRQDHPAARLPGRRRTCRACPSQHVRGRSRKTGPSRSPAPSRGGYASSRKRCGWTSGTTAARAPSGVGSAADGAGAEVARIPAIVTLKPLTPREIAAS